MILTLYDSYGNVKARIEPDGSSTQEKEIQGDNLLNLSFTLYEFIPVDVNDYIDYGGERYRAVEKYVPAEKSSVEWEYSLRLYGIESLIKRFLILNNTDGGNEAVFTLTARPIDHVRLIVKNINDGMAGTTDFKVGAVEGTDNVTIDYTGKYCNDGLKELAEAVGVEWWIEGETVNLCRCEHGEEITLGYDKGLTALDRDKADNAKFYTRLFPIGSSRNIDAAKYGHSRLMLPDGVKYVDVNVERYGIIHHYEQKAFAGIYPRRVGIVAGVRSKEVKDKDGKPFTIYYFKDNDLSFDPNDYEIGGLVKRVSFQEGSELAGLGTDNEHYFEVNYDSKTKEFEIITIWPYNDDTQLPGGTLVPKPGDKYILWNIRMPDEYYGLAEKEFRTAVDEYNRRNALDVSRYKALTDHVWIAETGTELFIGRRIRLESSEYFPGKGYRSSRITKIIRKVNEPGQMDLEISDTLSTGTMARVDRAIADAKNYAGTLVGGINVPDMIRSWDTTQPTDTNLYSARRTHKEFLSKNSPDRASRKITFEEGADYGDFVQGSKGASMWRDSEGNWHMETDYIGARRKLTAREVEIMKSSHIGGRILLSPASAAITRVKRLEAGFQCFYPKKDSDGNVRTPDFEMGDLAYCETFNLQRHGDTIGNHFYWRHVEDVGELGDDFFVLLSEGDMADGSEAPQAGDKVVTLGSRGDASRRNAIIVGGAGEGSPFIRAYKGISSYTLPEPVAQISPYGSWVTVNDGAGHMVKIQDALDAIVTSLSVVQQQNDEQMCLWFGDGVPTLDNFPAVDWAGDDMKLEHVKDIYYDRSDKTGGRAYSFEQVEGAFLWDNITDRDVLASLERASRAQDTADGKRRVFVGIPSTPYDVGDLWVNAKYPASGMEVIGSTVYTPDAPLYNDDVLRCGVSRAADEAFSINDWLPAQKMTTSEFESQIKQTAKTIDLSVTKKVTDGVNGVITELEAAGIHIDGENSKIILHADTTEVSDDIVVNKVKSKKTDDKGNPLIEIDGSTGTAFFAGKVTVLGSVSSPFTAVDDTNVEAMSDIVTDDPDNLGGNTLLLDWRKSGFSVLWNVTEGRMRQLLQTTDSVVAPKIILPTDEKLVGAEFEVYNRSTYNLRFTADVTLDVDVPANTYIPTSLVEPNTYTRYKFMYLPMKIDGSYSYVPGWVGFRRLDLRINKK